MTRKIINPRIKRVTILMTKEERTALRRQAKEMGVSEGELIRSALEQIREWIKEESTPEPESIEPVPPTEGNVQ